MDQHGWRRPTAPLAREFVRYAVAAGLASCVDVGVLVVLTSSLGVYYLHAAAIAFGAGLLTSYLLSITWVFQARTWQNPWVELGLFMLIGGIGLLGCGVCMWVLTEYVHLHYLCAKMGSALVVFLWNFVAKKWLVFRRSLILDSRVVECEEGVHGCQPSSRPLTGVQRCRSISALVHEWGNANEINVLRFSALNRKTQ